MLSQTNKELVLLFMINKGQVLTKVQTACASVAIRCAYLLFDVSDAQMRMAAVATPLVISSLIQENSDCWTGACKGRAL